MLAIVVVAWAATLTLAVLLLIVLVHSSDGGAPVVQSSTVRQGFGTANVPLTLGGGTGIYVAFMVRISPPLPCNTVNLGGPVYKCSYTIVNASSPGRVLVNSTPAEPLIVFLGPATYDLAIIVTKTSYSTPSGDSPAFFNATVDVYDLGPQ